MLRKFLLMAVVDVVLSINLFATELTPELKQKADMVFHGVDDTIMRINSGICRITGKTVEPGGNVINDDILIAFDYNNHFYRFDNGNLKKTLLTPDYFYEVWHPNDYAMSVKRSSAAAPDATSMFCLLVDIQNVFRFVPVGSHKPYAYQQLRFHKQNKEKITNYKELAKGLIKVTTEVPIIGITSEYLVNGNKGYTVEHIEMSNGYIRDISWKNINKTWVPVAYVFKSGSDFSVEWKIEWEQVNEKVDPLFFSLEEMVGDQGGGIPMFSEELGDQSILIGQVGKGVTSTTDQPKIKYPYLRYILITTGLILIVVALIKMAYDRWTKKH
jgi:uncharacterized membrane protein